jgi:hypothetical protein
MEMCIRNAIFEKKNIYTSCNSEFENADYSEFNTFYFSPPPSTQVTYNMHISIEESGSFSKASKLGLSFKESSYGYTSGLVHHGHT